jgi:dienelactone hydrolase
MLTSPALTPMKLLWWYRPFVNAIIAHIHYPTSRKGAVGSDTEISIDKAGIASECGVSVAMIYGTNDEFTGARTSTTFSRSFEGKEGYHAVEVSDAGHFWAGREEGARLQAALSAWLAS